MMKHLVWLALMALMFCYASAPAQADTQFGDQIVADSPPGKPRTPTRARVQQLERSSTKSTNFDEGIRLVDRVICVDGLKLYQVFAYYGPGPAVNTIQLYESRNGKLVPATCEDPTTKKTGK